MFLYLVYECEHGDGDDFELSLCGIYESLDDAIEHYEVVDESGEIVTLCLACSSKDVERQVMSKIIDYLAEKTVEKEKPSRPRKGKKKR